MQLVKRVTRFKINLMLSADSGFRRLNLSPAFASVVTYACGKKKLTERSGGISTIVKLLLKGCSPCKIN